MNRCVLGGAADVHAPIEDKASPRPTQNPARPRSLFISGMSMAHICVHAALSSPKIPAVLFSIDLLHSFFLYYTQTFTHQHLSIRGLKVWHHPGCATLCLLKN